MHLLPLPSLWGAPANLHLHSGPSNTTRWFWSSFLWSHFSFPLSLGACKVLFSPSKTGVSGPPVLCKFCNQIPLAFKVRFPGDSQSLCQVSRLGSLTWGSKPSQQWENFFGVIVLQFVGHPPRGYGIWFYHNCAPLPSSCGFFAFGCRYLFLVDFSVFLLMLVQQLVVILVLL